MSHCVYFHINPLKNHIFYVGIGNSKRPKSKQHRNAHWHKTVKKYGYIINIDEANLSKEAAIEREKFYINRIGRKDLGNGTLVNMTDGGEGQSVGCKGYWTGKKRIGFKRKSGIHYKRLHKRAPHSEITKKKMSETKLKNWKKKIISESTREKLRAINKGRKHSVESIENMRKSHIGKKHSTESIEKMRARKISEEVRDKISTTLKKRFESKRNGN